MKGELVNNKDKALKYLKISSESKSGPNPIYLITDHLNNKYQ
jgi:hypothetical protein